MTFNGFENHNKKIIVPEVFFSDLLPHIDDLAELKITLFCMWAMQQRERRYQYLTLEDFTGSEQLIAGLQTAKPDADPHDTLTAGLASAVERGTLLKGEISRSDGDKLTLYLMNSERGRDALEAISQGQVEIGEQVEILPPRPNIYRLYEQEIGPLTPMIGEGLTDLEKEYPAVWLPEAIRVAAEKQAKHLKFIRAVLERWRKEGKTDDEITGRHESMEHDGDGRRFVTGKYADYIDH